MTLGTAGRLLGIISPIISSSVYAPAAASERLLILLSFRRCRAFMGEKATGGGCRGKLSSSELPGVRGFEWIAGERDAAVPRRRGNTPSRGLGTGVVDLDFVPLALELILAKKGGYEEIGIYRVEGLTIQ